MDKVLKAIQFACTAHAKQTRKASQLPYIVHPHGVAILVQSFKKSKNIEDLVCAAYLHDVLEDTATDPRELHCLFGQLTASLVVELTNDPEAIKLQFCGSKTEYLKDKLAFRLTNYGLVIKLCDRLDNVLSQPSAKVLQSTKEILTFLVKNRKLTKTQQTLVNKINQLLY